MRQRRAKESKKKKEEKPIVQKMQVTVNQVVGIILLANWYLYVPRIVILFLTKNKHLGGETYSLILLGIKVSKKTKLKSAFQM